MLSETSRSCEQQMLDPLEHGVEAVGEAVELVAGAGHFQPAATGRPP